MACHGRGSLEQDAERHVGEGSSWLASNGKGAQDTGNRIRVTDPVELLMEGLPNRLRLAGGDQESDQRPSDQGRKLSKATSVVGATVYRGISVVDGWKQPTSLAGEGFRFLRTSILTRSRGHRRWTRGVGSESAERTVGPFERPEQL